MKPGVKVFKNSQGHMRYQPIIQLDNGTCLEYVKIVYPGAPSAISPREWVEEGINLNTKGKVYRPGLYFFSARAMTTSTNHVKILNEIQNDTASENEFKPVDRIWDDV